MQRQAVPLLFPKTPLVGTGLEEKVARDSGAVILARRDGVVVEVTAEKIIIDTGAVKPGESEEPLAKLAQFDRYRLKKFWRTNQDTAINQRPLVQLGQQVGEGEIIADGAATEGGELALGSNVLVAFMPWYGHNFEDAIVISEKLVKDDTYTSIHIQELELQVRDTKRGMEEITREIPNVAEESLVSLDERGIVRIGARVKAGDILVGKITPKGETPETWRTLYAARLTFEPDRTLIDYRRSTMTGYARNCRPELTGFFQLGEDRGETLAPLGFVCGAFLGMTGAREGKANRNQQLDYAHAVLLLLNSFAIWLRNRYEQKW
jgi:DNA-directed RNA polymerase beta subunit